MTKRKQRERKKWVCTFDCWGDPLDFQARDLDEAAAQLADYLFEVWPTYYRLQGERVHVDLVDELRGGSTGGCLSSLEWERRLQKEAAEEGGSVSLEFFRRHCRKALAEEQAP